jgi:hypothetical protein
MHLLELTHHLFQLHCLCHYLLFHCCHISELCGVLHLHFHQLVLELPVVSFQALELLRVFGHFRLAPLLFGPDLLTETLGLASKAAHLLV